MSRIAVHSAAHHVRSWLGLARAAAVRIPRWVAILRTRPAGSGRIRVFYGHEQVPLPAELIHGGMVKFQRLQAKFPNTPGGFNVLYLGSSSLPRDSRQLLWLAKKCGAAVVWNQDGVGYPAWHGPGWERVNEPMIRGIRAADHVFYQSEFCRLSADRYLGSPSGTSEILYNAVDTRVFLPAPGRTRSGRLTLVLGGTQYQRYRIEVALGTLAELVQDGLDARLLVTGRVSWPGEAGGERWTVARAQTLGIDDRVELVGPYSQADAPALLRRGDLLLHTKYNDPCPGVVIEAMSCGLPVVYSASGGVPELVGDDAGIGVSAPLDWEQDHRPSPRALADAVLRVLEHLDDHGEAARRRAVARFDVRPWIERHAEVFEALVG